MKTRLLIITGILLSLGLTGTAFATHDPTYNHPTPIPEPKSKTQEGGQFDVIKTNEDTITDVKLNILDNSSVLEFVGKTTNVDKEIGFSFYNPDGVLISVDTAFANSAGGFKSVITTGGPLWRQVGNFTFTAQQGEKLYPDNSLTFEMTEEMVQGKLDFMYKRTPYTSELSLKQQIADKIDWDDIQCPNEQHVLTERSNGKIACVYQSTAEKFGWYIYYPIEMPVISLFKIIKENETFEVNYEIKNGNVIDMINVHKDNSLIINIDSSKNGEVILYIPHGVIDPIPKDSGDNWLFVLINGEEVESKQIVDDELNRTVTINFNHIDPVIEIIASYWT